MDADGTLTKAFPDSIVQECSYTFALAKSSIPAETNCAAVLIERSKMEELSQTAVPVCLEVRRAVVVE